MDRHSASAETSAAGWPANALPRATSLNGYRIRSVLGQGGFGITYLADDLLDQSFALKEFFPRQFATRNGTEVVPSGDDERDLFDECRERFLREARVLLRLGRLREAASSIVHVHTFFEANRTAYLVMEFVRGNNLDRVLRDAGGSLPEPQLLTMLRGVLGGLHLIHEAGVAHRDIKPANIIVRPDGQPVLIDFGASRDIQSGQTSAFTQIYSGSYTPPEQFFGQTLGRYSDLYAVGAVAYRCIGGSLSGSTTRQAAIARGEADPMEPAVKVGQGRYASDTLSAIDQALRIDPALRPQSAVEMADRIGADLPETVLRAQVAARPPADELDTIIKAPARRLHPAAMIAGFLGLLIAGGAALIVWQSSFFDTRRDAGKPPASVASAAPSDAPPRTAPVSRPAAPADKPPLPPIEIARQPPPPAAASPPPPMAPPPMAAVAAPTPSPANPVAPTAVAPASVAPASVTPASVTPASVTPASATPASVTPPSVTPPSVTPPSVTSAAAAPPSVASPSVASSSTTPAQVQSVLGQPAPLQSAPLPPPRQQTAMLEQPQPLPEIPPGPCPGAVVIPVPPEARSEAFCASLNAIAKVIGFRVQPDATLALAATRLKVQQGGRITVDASGRPDATMLFSLFTPAGTVQHLRPTRRDGNWSAPLVATGAEGPRLLLAIEVAGDGAAELRSRPESEPAIRYTTAVANALPDAANVRIQALLLTILPIPPVPVASSPAAPQNSISHRSELIPSRCARIMERAQLGESLSDADLSALRGECRR